MRLFSVKNLSIYIHSNSGIEFFRNLRWMPSGPNDLLTFNFLSSSFFYTNTQIHIYIYIEGDIFRKHLSKRWHLYSLEFSHSKFILHSQWQRSRKRNHEKHLKHSDLLWLLSNILRELMISVTSWSCYTSTFPFSYADFPYSHCFCSVSI